MLKKGVPLEEQKKNRRHVFRDGGFIMNYEFSIMNSKYF